MGIHENRGNRIGRTLALASIGCAAALLLAAALGGDRTGAQPHGQSSAEASRTAQAAKRIAGGRRAAFRFRAALTRIEPIARRRWPQTFGGAWINQRGRVILAFTTRPGRKLRRLRRSFPLRRGVPRRSRGFPQPRKLRVRKVVRSLLSMEQRQRAMVAERGEIIESGGPLPELETIPYDLDIDVKRNAIVVTFPDPTPEMVAAVKARYGADVIVEDGPISGEFACDARDSCTPDLRSGLKVTMTPGAAGGCSTGFVALHRSLGQAILSASHCGGADIGSARYHKGIRYGTVLHEQLQGRIDAEVHRVNANGFKAGKPLIFRDPTHKFENVNRVGLWDKLLVGQRVCKAGYKTNYSCGKVLSKQYAPSKVPNSERFVRATTCAQPGDSGSGVFYEYRLRTSPKVQRYQAEGILRGGAVDPDDPDLPLPCADENFFMSFSHIQYVRSAFPIAIRQLIVNK